MLQPKITNMVFNSALFILFALINFSVLAQNEWQNIEDSWLQGVMPLAESFSEVNFTSSCVIIKVIKPTI